MQWILKQDIRLGYLAQQGHLVKKHLMAPALGVTSPGQALNKVREFLGMERKEGRDNAQAAAILEREQKDRASRANWAAQHPDGIAGAKMTRRRLRKQAKSA